MDPKVVFLCCLLWGLSCGKPLGISLITSLDHSPPVLPRPSSFAEFLLRFNKHKELSRDDSDESRSSPRISSSDETQSKKNDSRTTLDVQDKPEYVELGEAITETITNASSFFNMLKQSLLHLSDAANDSSRTSGDQESDVNHENETDELIDVRSFSDSDIERHGLMKDGSTVEETEDEKKKGVRSLIPVTPINNEDDHEKVQKRSDDQELKVAPSKSRITRSLTEDDSSKPTDNDKWSRKASNIPSLVTSIIQDSFRLAGQRPPQKRRKRSAEKFYRFQEGIIEHLMKEGYLDAIIKDGASEELVHEKLNLVKARNQSDNALSDPPSSETSKFEREGCLPETCVDETIKQKRSADDDDSIPENQVSGVSSLETPNCKRAGGLPEPCVRGVDKTNKQMSSADGDDSEPEIQASDVPTLETQQCQEAGGLPEPCVRGVDKTNKQKRSVDDEDSKPERQASGTPSLVTSIIRDSFQLAGQRPSQNRKDRSTPPKYHMFTEDMFLELLSSGALKVKPDVPTLEIQQRQGAGGLPEPCVRGVDKTSKQKRSADDDDFKSETQASGVPSLETLKCERAGGVPEPCVRGVDKTNKEKRSVDDDDYKSERQASGIPSLVTSIIRDSFRLAGQRPSQNRWERSTPPKYYMFTEDTFLELLSSGALKVKPDVPTLEIQQRQGAGGSPEPRVRGVDKTNKQKRLVDDEDSKPEALGIPSLVTSIIRDSFRLTGQRPAQNRKERSIPPKYYVFTEDVFLELLSSGAFDEIINKERKQDLEGIDEELSLERAEKELDVDDRCDTDRSGNCIDTPINKRPADDERPGEDLIRQDDVFNTTLDEEEKPQYVDFGDVVFGNTLGKTLDDLIESTFKRNQPILERVFKVLFMEGIFDEIMSNNALPDLWETSPEDEEDVGDRMQGDTLPLFDSGPVRSGQLMMQALNSAAIKHLSSLINEQHLHCDL